MPTRDPIERLIQGFVSEAGDISESITRDVLVLERGGSDLMARYENVARGLHTLKGGAGTLGLKDLERLAHALESALLPHRDAGRPLGSRDADALLRGLDTLMFRLRAHAEGRGAELDGIDEALPTNTSAEGRPWLAVPQDSFPPPANEPLAQHHDLPRDGGAQTWPVAPHQVTALTVEVERLRFMRLRLDERRRDLARARSMLTLLLRGREAGETQALLSKIDAAISTDGEEITSVVDALEQGVKDIGTQPIRVILEPLHRAVRDLCRTTGKEARFSVVGGEACLDRRVLAALKGPIVHLIRNAVAHGIETPDVRRARGKHEEGAIVIRIEQQGNVVFIEVSDDGEGLKGDAIRRAALLSGVATDAELAAMPAEQVNRLIFLPTVSTADEVTATSGRGMGMDAVQKGLETIHGKVEVHSTPQQGLRVLLTFPAGLGSSPVLIVRTDEQYLGIPTRSVSSILPVKRSNLVVGRHETTLRHQDETLPVVDLGAILGLRPRRRIEGGQLLVIHSHVQHAALWVDEIAGDVDLTIRPLPRGLAGLPLYQGAARLARGELVLVLRPEWLVGERQSALGAPANSRSALVVDDSNTSRAIHRSMLEVGGYTVHSAAGAPQAMDQIGRARYDVIVCDLAMSPLEGLALVRMVRGRPDTRDVAIIVVSGRDGARERDEALAAGADGFLSKAQSTAGRLLDEVAQVIARHQGAA
ncbi:MAG: response regulator [Myxococcota bacterium]|nr:response regulator [Myxococcota bacterium]